MANVAEAGGMVVEGTQQPRDCTLLQENGAEEHDVGGVGSTATIQTTETPECRKRQDGSSLGEVLI